jgi:hypothetical protein
MGTSVFGKCAECNIPLHAGEDVLSRRPGAPSPAAAGIPRSDIVLGFQPAEVPPMTGFGVD